MSPYQYTKDYELLPLAFKDTETVADPLTEHIAISQFEKRIISCPEFQRLRFIKQLGFASLAYPSADYCRFVHSLGACYQAKAIVDTINRNMDAQKRYQQWRLFGREQEGGYGNTFLISPFERAVIAAAALLHDLSHAPFSHEIEGVPGDKKKNLIPDHDNLEENPALFIYLFDTQVSDLALLLTIYNRIFFSPLLEACAGYDVTAMSYGSMCKQQDWRYSIAWLRAHNVLTAEGNIRVNASHSPIKCKDTVPIQYKDLPLLAVMIFETLLFERQETWLSEQEENTLSITTSSPDFLIVSTGFKDSYPKLQWRPIPGWFRAYRHDIIGNTICADLLDYVNRDGYHTGIVSHMDLKFLDRMLIARALVPPKPTANEILYEDIPVSCEHVIFDIFDHKRGFIRQSVLTEILSYLQGRYLLCERVYIHRVVEGARSMLQEIVAILCKATDSNGDAFLTVEKLHPLSSRGIGKPLSPVTDMDFLTWVRYLPSANEGATKNLSSDLERAAHLAELLLERRVFREAIICDGIHGYQNAGYLRGAVETCLTLEKAVLTGENHKQEFRALFENMHKDLLGAWNHINPGVKDKRETPLVTCLIGARKWGKRYKPPMVLVTRPLHQDTRHSTLDVEPLLNCADPPNIKKHLDAMKDSYDSLWKVYVFVHPLFHQRVFDHVHRTIERSFLNYAQQSTGAEWRNAVRFDQLLPAEAIDNVSFLRLESKDFMIRRFPDIISSLKLAFDRAIRNVVETESSDTLDRDDSTKRLLDFVSAPDMDRLLSEMLMVVGTNEELDTIIELAPGYFEDNFRNETQNLAQVEAAREIESVLRNCIATAVQRACGNGSIRLRGLPSENGSGNGLHSGTIGSDISMKAKLRPEHPTSDPDQRKLL